MQSLTLQCPHEECVQSPAEYGREELEEHIAKIHLARYALYFCPKCKEEFAVSTKAYAHIKNVCRVLGILQVKEYTKGLLQYVSSYPETLHKMVNQAICNKLLNEKQVYEHRLKSMENTFCRLEARESFPKDPRQPQRGLRTPAGDKRESERVESIAKVQEFLANGENTEAFRGPCGPYGHESGVQIIQRTPMAYRRLNEDRYYSYGCEDRASPIVVTDEGRDETTDDELVESTRLANSVKIERPSRSRKSSDRDEKNFKRVETPDHVCEYEHCCDAKKGSESCAFCFGLHRNEDCAAVIEVTERKAVAAVCNGLCHICLTLHSRKFSRCPSMSCKNCFYINHPTVLCWNNKRKTDDLKAYRKKFELPLTLKLEAVLKKRKEALENYSPAYNKRPGLDRSLVVFFFSLCQMATPNKKPLLFKCTECKQAPPEIRDVNYIFVDLLEHLAYEHTDKFALYFCPACKIGFATPFHVHAHIRRTCKMAGIIQMETYIKNLLKTDHHVVYHYQRLIEISVIDRLDEEARKTAGEYMGRIAEYVEEVSQLQRKIADQAENISRMKFLLDAQQQPVPVQGADFRGLSTTPRSPPPPGVQAVTRAAKTWTRPGPSRHAESCERSPRMERGSSQVSSSQQFPPINEDPVPTAQLAEHKQRLPPSEPALTRPIKQEHHSPEAERGYGYSPIPDHFPTELEQNVEAAEESVLAQPAREASPPPPRSPSPDKRFQPRVLVEEKPFGMGSPNSAGLSNGSAEKPVFKEIAPTPVSQTLRSMSAHVSYSHLQWADVNTTQRIGDQSASPDVKPPTGTNEPKPQPISNPASSPVAGIGSSLTKSAGEKPPSIPLVPAVEERKNGPTNPPTVNTAESSASNKEVTSTTKTPEIPPTKTTSNPVESKPSGPIKVLNNSSKGPAPKKTLTNTQKAVPTKSSAPVLARRPELKRFELPTTAAGPSLVEPAPSLVTIDDEDDLVLKDEDSEEDGEFVEVPVPVQEEKVKVEEEQKKKKKEEEESKKKMRNWKPKEAEPAAESSSRKRRGSTVGDSKIKPAKRQKYVRFETELHVCAYENCCQDLSIGPCAFCHGRHQPENCATFVDFEDRRISCLLTTFCYHCLKLHPLSKRCANVPCRFCRRSNHHAAFCRSKENGQNCSRLHRIGLTKRLPDTPHLQTLFELRRVAKRIVDYDGKGNPHWIKFTEQHPSRQRYLTFELGQTYQYLLLNNPYQQMRTMPSRVLSIDES